MVGISRVPKEEVRVISCVTIVGNQGILREIAPIPKGREKGGARASPPEVKVRVFMN